MIPATVLRGDARSLPLPAESVDLIVTSPPYFALRSYQDGGEHYDGQLGSERTPREFVDALLEVTAECVRVLKPTGSLWVNLGDKYSRGSRPLAQPDQFRDGDAITYDDERYVKDTSPENSGIVGKSLMGIPWRYAIRCIDELGLILRAEVIWSKPNGLPESVTDRVRRSHEQWFHFTREPRYFSAIDTIREDYSPATSARYALGYRRQTDAAAAGQTTNAVLRLDSGGPTSTNPLGKLPGSVWTVATEPLVVPEDLGIDHFAAFPTEWPKRIIRGWSPSGVCTVCGEGRRPAVRTEQVPYRDAGASGRLKSQDTRGGHEANGWNGSGYPQTVSVTSIDGETCACNEPIATPLGRATGYEVGPTGSRESGDPSKVVGRAGMARPRLEDAGVRIITRWEQLHEAGQLRESPHRHEMHSEAGPAFAHYVRTDRAGARPIPEDLRVSWRERGWLEPAPAFVPPATTPAVVLDVFGGTGTTAMVASALGRHGISVDMSSDYCRLAAWRTTSRDQLAKVLGVAKAVQQPPEQLELFG